MNKSLHSKDQTKPSESTEPIGGIPRLYVELPTPLTVDVKQSKPSVGTTKMAPLTPSTTTTNQKLKPTSDEQDACQQHAAIARAAIRALLKAGKVTLVLAKNKNQVRVCFDLDTWTQDLKLR